MDAGELQEVVRDMRLIGDIMVSSMAIVAYDYVVTLPSEIEFIWHARWTPGKILFLFVRYVPFVFLASMYYPFIASPNAEVCQYGVRAYSMVGLFQCMLADIVIALRTWVLWERARLALLLISVAWITSLAVALYYEVPIVEGQEYYIGYPPQLHIPGCLLGGPVSASTVRATFIIWGVYELVILSMTVLRGLVHLRHGSTAKLVTVLYRDAFMASICFASVTIVMIILTQRGQETWAAGVSSTYTALKCVLPGRIVLNIRESVMSLDGWDIPTSVPPITISRDAVASSQAGTSTTTTGF